MKNENVLAVLTNWKRAKGTRLCAETLMSQCHVAVIDNHNLGDAPYDGPYHERWQFPDRGPPGRWLAALLETRFKYAYFHDEDMLPGTKVVDYFYTCAEYLKGQGKDFSTLCQNGRRYLQGPGNLCRYTARGVMPRDKFQCVDNGCRAHFVEIKHLVHAVDMRQDALNAGHKNLAWVHDDLALCLGIQRAIGLPTVLLPVTNDKQETIQVEPLEDNDAVSHRPTHYQERTDFVNLAVRLGWVSNWRNFGEANFTR